MICRFTEFVRIVKKMNNMKILVTAFDPFGGFDTNSSMLTLEKISNKIGDITVDKMIIPTVYYESADKVIKKVESEKYDAVLCLGQAGGRRAVTVEVMGINYACADLKDNNNVKIDGEKLLENAENALFSTMPVKKMAEEAKKCGFEATLSVSAGGFVCNSLLYLLLESRCAKKIGFVHLPYATEQNNDGFSMSGDEMARCVEKMIEVI